MLNPITYNRRYLATYLSMWLAFALMQTSIFHYFFVLDLYASLVDAVTFNFLLSIIGLAIWPLVSFSSLERARIANTMVTHIAGASVLIALLLFINYNVVSYLLESNIAYLQFLEESLLLRAAIATIIYMLMALNYYVVIYNQEFKVRKINESELKQSLKEAELDMLKSQLNPHFIFNSLNSISSLTITNPEKAQEMVISLSAFLRYSIKPNQDKLIALSSEIEAVKQFISIEKVRFGDRLDVSINCSKQCSTYLLPPLIIQPLIENAIKYGVHESLDKAMIRIDCVCVNSVLEINVKNTFDADSKSTIQTGIGLKNVANRLRLIYESGNLLQVSQQKTIFNVQLLIPQ